MHRAFGVGARRRKSLRAVIQIAISVLAISSVSGCGEQSSAELPEDTATSLSATLKSLAPYTGSASAPAPDVGDQASQRIAERAAPLIARYYSAGTRLERQEALLEISEVAPGYIGSYGTFGQPRSLNASAASVAEVASGLPSEEEKAFVDEAVTDLVVALSGVDSDATVDGDSVRNILRDLRDDLSSASFPEAAARLTTLLDDPVQRSIERFRSGADELGLSTPLQDCAVERVTDLTTGKDLWAASELEELFRLAGVDCGAENPQAVSRFAFERALRRDLGDSGATADFVDCVVDLSRERITDEQIEQEAGLRRIGLTLGRECASQQEDP